MDPKTRDTLVARFDKKLVKTRKSSFGKVAYVSGREYVKRLNAAFGFEWSFEVLEHRIEGEEVLVLGRLTAAGISKDAFGGSQITRSTSSGEIISLVDDFKSAETDSIKKAASYYGVGLELQEGESSSQGQSKPQTKTNFSRKPTNGQSFNGNASPQDRITMRQLGAINSLARKANYSAEDIIQKAQAMFGAPPERFTKAQASEIISDLSDELGGAAA